MEAIQKQEQVYQGQISQQKNVLNNEKQGVGHLIKWVLYTSSSISLSKSFKLIKNLTSSLDQSLKIEYGLSQIYHSNYLAQILHQVCPERFSIHMTNSQIQLEFIDYFFHQFGFYINPLLGIGSQKQKIFITLVLYVCVYCFKKQVFVEKILQLQQQVQEKILQQIQLIQLELKQLGNYGKMTEEIQRLQQQNTQYKNLITTMQEQSQVYKQKIKLLQKQLCQFTKQRNEKKKQMSKYMFSNMSEYEEVCSRLQLQNQFFSKKQKKLMSTIDDLKTEVTLLNKHLQNSDKIILQINTQFHQLQKNYSQLSRQYTEYRQSVIFQNQSKMIEQKNTFRFNQIGIQSVIKNNDQPKRFTSFSGSGFFKKTYSSDASSRNSFGRNTRVSAISMFKTTKDNVLLNEKIRHYQEQIQVLKLKIIQLQAELDKCQKRQKDCLKKYRKVLNQTDYFKKQYQKATNFALTL